MKKIFLILSVVLVSCDAKIQDAVVVEQININSGSGASHKYEVKLKSSDGAVADVYYYTDFRYQINDTLISTFEFFEGRNADVQKLRKENDSLKKELEVNKYYLQILRERVIFDTVKKR